MAVVPARTSRPDLGVPFAPEPRVAASGTLFSASEAPSSPAEVVSAHAREQTRCRSVVDRAMASSPLLQFMVKAIKGRNCELADPLVVCAPIPKAPIEGGYNHDRRQVLVNSLVIKSQSDALTLLLHELTHAYDACRVYVDPGNCRHSACSEIRASNLSTECSWQNEWFGTRRTPHLGFRAQQQACVKRRAAKSIGMLEACKGKDPRAVVDSVFERCYADTAPFPRTPI
ncbi:hypothetical protein FNF29_05271 [Cafeteria roenbergensis]|uniref:Mitochondrial inner membrane protease ATP23 n=1 Tax=Cafeteria roenbergensis TaxID=33653 RepID=A0A5A8CC72_CAFRO|nr:hypothetical protein FNF29_05271 [Cafeteria roenbergensis]KAA0162026.1 hypothetical protein FNF31_03437 [Cafeteria roenbergensis]KAA0167665.1 hypothetical protein FNF28_02733 [Cafeteria roenbergensis]|eukprot:KAA0150468.1 hypothetical protein FNF29_05271 [Cafeteria roenbergensis]